MKINPSWGSHLPTLIRVLQASEGPVLELGSGPFSTPILHWLCLDSKRPLVTYENDAEYFEMYKKFGYGLHEFKLVEDWASIPSEDRRWGVVFVDHKPAERRKIEIIRLINVADYIVVHDTEPQVSAEYDNLGETFPLFKYQYHYRRQKPYTTVLSNFSDFTVLL